MLRTCRKCGVEKELDEFVSDPRGREGRMHRCKACHASIARARWHTPEVKERDLARRKEWHQKHYRMRRYGITWAEYEQMFAAQGRCCALCKSKTASPSSRSFEWCIDHCHKTGKVRGILCHACNTTLGHYEKLLEQLGKDRIHEYLGWI